MDFAGKQLVVVSNRLPAAIYQNDGGEWHIRLSPGGLVTALSPIMKQTGGLWIGWPGCSSEAPAERLLHDYSHDAPYELIPVKVTDKEIAAVRWSLKRGSPFGNETWVEATARRLDLESTLRPRGRPQVRNLSIKDS